MIRPDDAEIVRAAGVLRAGGLVAFPTETVYGLGADASNPVALHRLYAVKGRPLDHPVIVHVPDAADLDRFALGVPDVARHLAAEHWPGPLTLVLRRDPTAVAAEATGGRDTVGLRVPAHPLALALLRAFGGGVAAPSANRFGRVSPTTAAHVIADLGTDVDVVLDGGPCAVGVESTIVDCTSAPVALLRVGGVPIAAIEAVAGTVALRTTGDVAAPGTLPSHYAPQAAVEIVDRATLPDRVAAHLRDRRRVAVIVPQPQPPLPEGALVVATPDSTEAYAGMLYTSLRDADRLGADVVVAVPPGPGGLGDAVIDRLRRAAAG